MSKQPVPIAATLISASDAAQHLGVSVGTLAVWRSTGRYPLPYVKIGRKVMYKRKDLEAFIEARTRVFTIGGRGR